MTTAPPLPADAHPGHVTLRVADLDRAVAFYRDVLGLRVTDTDGATATLAAPGADGPAGPALLTLRQGRGLRRRPARPVTTGLYHVAFLVPTRADLGHALAALARSGHPLRGASDHAVSESLYLDDPDGNGLEIYADRPRSRWRWANGRVHMTVDPFDADGVMAAARAAGPPAHPAALAAGTVVGHLHFTVADLERATAFYRDAVGFDEVARLPGLTGVSAGGYHHHLNLNTWAGPGAPPDDPGTAGLDAWTLVVPDADARAALAARLGADATGAVPDPDGVRLVVAGAP